MPILNTSGSAVAKVLKEKAGLNVVVQPTAGESVLIPLVSRGEAEFGIANILEVQAAKASAPNLRLIGSLHPLRGAFWVRKDSNMRTMADLKRAARLPGDVTAADETTWRYFFEKPDDILIVCAGGRAGSWSACLPGWGNKWTKAVTTAIGEIP
jgi:hypothetical protein